MAITGQWARSIRTHAYMDVFACVYVYICCDPMKVGSTMSCLATPHLHRCFVCMYEAINSCGHSCSSELRGGQRDMFTTCVFSPALHHHLLCSVFAPTRLPRRSACGPSDRAHRFQVAQAGLLLDYKYPVPIVLCMVELTLFCVLVT